MENEKLLTLRGLADFLGLSYEQAKRLRKGTDIPQMKLGRYTMYRARSVKSWLDKLEEEAANGRQV